MIFVYGTRLYGKVRRSGPTFVATRFFHFWFLPLFPLATLVVFDQRPGDGACRSLPGRLSGRSILAGYLRTWGVVAGAGAVLGAISMFAEAMERGSWLDLGLAPLIVFVTVATVAGAFFSLGRLSAAEQAQQAVYARFVGAPIDPTLLAERRHEVRRAVEAALSERAQSLGLLGYRNEGVAGADYTRMAQSEAVRDIDFLESALTKARLDQAENRGAGKRDHAARHAAIWQRLTQLRAERDASATAAA